MLSILTKPRIQSYSIGEFLNKQNKYSSTKLYSIAGIDITLASIFNFHNFNAPYLIVFGVAGVILFSALIENYLLSSGNHRKAEMVNNITGLLLPVSFYIFLFIGIFKIL